MSASSSASRVGVANTASGGMVVLDGRTREVANQVYEVVQQMKILRLKAGRRGSTSKLDVALAGSRELLSAAKGIVAKSLERAREAVKAEAAEAEASASNTTATSETPGNAEVTSSAAAVESSAGVAETGTQPEKTKSENLVRLEEGSALKEILELSSSVLESILSNNESVVVRRTQIDQLVLKISTALSALDLQAWQKSAKEGIRKGHAALEDDASKTLMPLAAKLKISQSQLEMLLDALANLGVVVITATLTRMMSETSSYNWKLGELLYHLWSLFVGVRQQPKSKMPPLFAEIMGAKEVTECIAALQTVRNTTMDQHQHSTDALRTTFGDLTVLLRSEHAVSVTTNFNALHTELATDWNYQILKKGWEKLKHTLLEVFVLDSGLMFPEDSLGKISGDVAHPRLGHVIYAMHSVVLGGFDCNLSDATLDCDMARGIVVLHVPHWGVKVSSFAWEFSSAHGIGDSGTANAEVKDSTFGATMELVRGQGSLQGHISAPVFKLLNVTVNIGTVSVVVDKSSASSIAALCYNWLLSFFSEALKSALQSAVERVCTDYLSYWLAVATSVSSKWMGIPPSHPSDSTTTTTPEVPPTTPNTTASSSPATSTANAAALPPTTSPSPNPDSDGEPTDLGFFSFAYL
ncbi:hypothetical protein Pelo_13213 [Pelomyxa schiedti]|nr:hypothetical protein Pelo_13213 [Pelomyxa schiedti]